MRKIVRSDSEKRAKNPQKRPKMAKKWPFLAIFGVFRGQNDLFWEIWYFERVARLKMHKKHLEWKRFTQRIKPRLKCPYSPDFLYRPRVSTIFDFLWKSHRTKVLFDFFQRKTKIFLLSNLYHLIYLKWSHIYPQNIKYILVMCYVWRHRVVKGTKNDHI